ncbi:hypothetical protein ACVRW7_03355 [Streptococcus ratti]|uniref:hypothetical protein n=1 Tax=Streptococcus ratti TaxID=1341 RepID=UPI000F83A508|nr:hypothetical protein [Streptococcus ratti]QEY07360.1 hypothetical protein FY406_06795 [Streptococcus ratti]
MDKLFSRGLGGHLTFIGAAHQSGNMQQKKDLGQMAKAVLSLVSERKLKVPIARSFTVSISNIRKRTTCWKVCC